MNQTITMTIEQLERLLDQQKALVIERLAGETYLYNTESTDGHMRSINIDKEKFKKSGMGARYPDDLIVLKRYIK